MRSLKFEDWLTNVEELAFPPLNKRVKQSILEPEERLVIDQLEESLDKAQLLQKLLTETSSATALPTTPVRNLGLASHFLDRVFGRVDENRT